MKRLLPIFAFVFLLFGITKAATGDLWDWMDNLNNDIPFGYTINQKISIDQITPDKVVIKTPVIQDDLGNKIKKYTVMFSPYPLSQILENATLLDQSKEKTFEFTNPGNEVTMELNASTDGINPSNVYYLSIIPKDDNGILWEISNEIRFKLATQMYGEGTSTGENTSFHTAPWADMSLANVTHTISNNKATLRWTAVDGSDKIDIFLWNPTSTVFERLASVNMADEQYTFTLTRNGEYIVNFVPNNWWKEYRYTFVANGITSTTSTTTPIISNNIPATWPQENMLIIFAITVVVYFVYRKVKAKH